MEQNTIRNICIAFMILIVIVFLIMSHRFFYYKGAYDICVESGGQPVMPFKCVIEQDNLSFDRYLQPESSQMGGHIAIKC